MRRSQDLMQELIASISHGLVAKTYRFLVGKLCVCAFYSQSDSHIFWQDSRRKQLNRADIVPKSSVLTTRDGRRDLLFQTKSSSSMGSWQDATKFHRSVRPQTRTGRFVRGVPWRREVIIREMLSIHLVWWVVDIPGHGCKNGCHEI